MNKRLISSVLAGCAVALVATSWATQSPTKNGTDILHFFVRKGMTNEFGASGRVEAKQNQQGKANNQRLDIVLSGLSTNTPYQLFAVLDTATNLTPILDFITDANGGAALRYRTLANGHGILGKGKSVLPAILDPISHIRELAVYDSSTQAVLTADLTTPDKLQYLIKRNLSTNNVDAMLRIKATTQQTQFRLLASGLNVTNDYLLVLNGGIVQTNSTDAKGKLMINSLAENPDEILDLRTVALWDSVSNVILTTDLP